MELKNFDNILSRVPKLADPLRVVLAGSKLPVTAGGYDSTGAGGLRR